MFILRQINSIKANLSFICFAVAFTSIATVLNWSKLEPLQLIYKKEPDCNLVLFYYSRSFLFGFRDGSLERNPKVKSEIKKITTVYTNIFSVNIYQNRLI